jgi:cell division protein FtsZ
MAFITAGMGGGTGTGSASVVAGIVKQSGALTIGVVTRPFSFEGLHRSQVADAGIAELIDKVDTLVIIPNDRLFALCNDKMGVDGAFQIADGILCHGVQAIAEVVTVPGLINLDFADIRTIMKDAGPAWMSIGRGTGKSRAHDAAKEALSSPLLDVSIEGSRGVLFNVAGGSDLSLYEVNEAAEVIRQAVDPEANVIFGVVLDPNMNNDVRLTLVATGFENKDHGLSGMSYDREMNRLIKGIKSEEELGVPAFMRYRRTLSGSSRPAATPNKQNTWSR